jgi:hypothetical protein
MGTNDTTTDHVDTPVATRPHSRVTARRPANHAGPSRRRWWESSFLNPWPTIPTSGHGPGTPRTA